MRRYATCAGAVLVLLPLLLAACTGGLAARQAKLQVFVGRPVNDVVQAMGVPNRTYEANGVSYIAYVEQRYDLIPTSPFLGPGWGWGWGWGWSGQFPPQVVTWRCETTFQVVGGIVRSFNLTGNACD
jgi:hypothetical protein